ncbi:MAG: DUF3231 family protein [Desulfosporosinus sp.]|nr:DUF3231 family protein [Desulfosporosinus sp.]
MQNSNNIPLVTSEIASLWNSYMSDSASICMFKYFLNNIEDNDIRSIIQHALSLSEEHLGKMKKLFKQEDFSTPLAFSEEDVDINAPRLYTDSYYISYLGLMAGFGLNSYSLVLRLVSRGDVRKYFSDCITETLDLYNKAVDLQISKGLLIKAPQAEVLKDVAFVENTSFLKGFLLDHPRSLLAREVANIYNAILIDLIWRALILGLCQVAKSPQVKDFMYRGKNTITYHFDGFSSLLIGEDIPVPSTSESFVTDSTVSPFSEKLMMFQAMSMCIVAVSVDGYAITSSLRSDLIAKHVKYAAEILKYASDGEKLMINNGWQEQPPQVVRHEELAPD